MLKFAVGIKWTRGSFQIVVANNTSWVDTRLVVTAKKKVAAVR